MLNVLESSWNISQAHNESKYIAGIIIDQEFDLHNNIQVDQELYLFK